MTLRIPKPFNISKLSKASQGTVGTTRWFYVDKEGTIYDLKGGMNTYIETLNYAAGYHDKNFNAPVIVAWNGTSH